MSLMGWAGVAITVFTVGVLWVLTGWLGALLSVGVMLGTFMVLLDLEMRGSAGRHAL